MRTFLSDYKESGKYIVNNICKKSGLYPRLVGQGLHNGKEFEVISFTQGKYILKVDNSKLTLDESMAQHIRVSKCGKACLWARVKNKFRVADEECNPKCHNSKQELNNDDTIRVARKENSKKITG